jgi:hypothetical protein
VERVAASSSIVDRMTDVRALSSIVDLTTEVPGLSSEKWCVRGDFSEQTA